MLSYSNKKAEKENSAVNSSATTAKESALQLKDNRPQSLLQRKQTEAVAQKQATANDTGLPDQLKSGIENLSGYSMDDVKVHYNSSQPAQLNAHAYAQGTEIHIAPGQEKHLPHEAWHVVQQKQGRVKPTMQMKEKVNVNNDPGLEKEADVMGDKAIQTNTDNNNPVTSLRRSSAGPGNKRFVIQGRFYEWNPDGKTEEERYIWHRGPVIGYLWMPKKDGEEQEMHNGFGVWVRKGTSSHIVEIVKESKEIASLLPAVQEGYEEFKEQVIERIGTREQVIDRLKLAQETTEKYAEEIGKVFSRYTITIMAAVVGATGIAAAAQHFLSLPGIPMGVKAAIDIAGILYGGFVTFRWMKTELLPLMARLVLVTGNTAIWAYTIYSLLVEALNGHWFASVHIAALPLAMTVEFIIRRVMSKVEKMMAKKHGAKKESKQEV